MTELRLSAEEAALLREVLESALADLREEMAHTDALPYRDMLRARRTTLQRVLDTLASGGGGERAA